MLMMLLGSATGPIPVQGDLAAAIELAFRDDRVYAVEVFDAGTGGLIHSQGRYFMRANQFIGLDAIEYVTSWNRLGWQVVSESTEFALPFRVCEWNFIPRVEH